MCSSPLGCQVEGRKGMKAVSHSTYDVSLTSLCQVTKPAAQAVEAAAQTTSVPPNLTSSPPKHRLSTQTGGRWRLQPHSLAGHCRRCSSSSSALYCGDSGDNPGSSQRNCVLATETAYFLLFLYSWTMDHATNTCSFLQDGSYCNLLPILVFPKSTRCQTELLPAFFRYLWRQYPLLREFFLNPLLQETFWASFPFMLQKGKKILEYVFFPSEKKDGGRNQESFLSDSSLTQGCCISTEYQQNKTKKTRKEQKKKMQPFFTDRQVSFRNFYRMIQVIRMITVIGRKAGFFFPQHKVCLSSEFLHSICQPHQIGMKVEKLKTKFIF